MKHVTKLKAQLYKEGGVGTLIGTVMTNTSTKRHIVQIFFHNILEDNN